VDGGGVGAVMRAVVCLFVQYWIGRVGQGLASWGGLIIGAEGREAERQRGREVER
jgi:hypothetical protein